MYIEEGDRPCRLEPGLLSSADCASKLFQMFVTCWWRRSRRWSLPTPRTPPSMCSTVNEIFTQRELLTRIYLQIFPWKVRLSDLVILEMFIAFVLNFHFLQYSSSASHAPVNGDESSCILQGGFSHFSLLVENILNNFFRSLFINVSSVISHMQSS